jgi:DNA primase
LVTFGAGNLSAVKNFVRPKQDVWFFADNDATGIKAANDAAQELEQHGFVLLPSLTDFNEDFQSAMGQSNFVRIKQAFKNVRRQK